MRSARTWVILIGAALLVTIIPWLLARQRPPQPSSPPPEAAQAPDQATPPAPSPGQAPQLAIARSAAIAGSVRDPAGAPIAAAQVCAWVREHGQTHPPQCSSSTADGRYQLSSLWPGQLIVHASAPGFLPAQSTGPQITLAPNQILDPLDFTLAPGGVPLRGVVRDIAGGVVEGAWVVARSAELGSDNRAVARSDAHGRFTTWTRAGRVQLGVEAQGYARASQLVAAPGPSFDLFLTPESVIVGRVTQAIGGAPVEGVTILARAQGAELDPASTRSDPSGRFRVAGLEPGIYELEARADQLYGEASELVHLGLVETVEHIAIELHPAFRLRGRVIVTGEGGDRPCAEGRVQLIDRLDGHSGAAASLRQGEAVFRGVLPGTYEVAVHCEGAVADHEYPDLLVGPAPLDELLWTVRDGLTLHGLVLDSDGAPLSGLRVRARMQGPPAAPSALTTTRNSAPSRPDGSFSITGLLPGTYQLAPDYPSETRPVEVLLAPGRQAPIVELLLPRQGAIAGHVHDDQGQPLAGIAVQIAPVRRGGARVAISDEQGRFGLEQLAPGPHRVLAFDEQAGVLAQVEPGQTTQIELVLPPRHASIRGRVLDSEGSPVADAFVRHQLMSAAAQWSASDPALLTDPDGRFAIQGLLAAVPYRIGAFRRGGGEVIVEGVEAGQPLLLTLVDTAEITGQVLGPGGLPPDQFRLTVHAPSTGFMRSVEPFRSHGQFRVQQLPPGDYLILVEAPEGVARLEGMQLDPGARAHDLLIPLTPRVRVRGRLVDQRTREPVPGVTVTIGLHGTALRFGPPRPSELTRMSGADGRFELSDAPTGKVRISLEPPSADSPYDWQWLDAELPARGEFGEPGEFIELGELELSPAPT